MDLDIISQFQYKHETTTYERFSDESVKKVFIIKRYSENQIECRCDERLKVKGEGSTRVPHIHWVAWGTGTPKDRDEVNRREV